jgi:Ca2+-binding EF-hand superfamily protein
MVDADSSGAVSPAEFVAAMPGGVFAGADSNVDGVLTAQELAGSSAGLALLLGDTDNSGILSDAEAAAVVAVLDGDESGFLTAAEFLTAAQLSALLPAHAFATTDRDGSGEISLAEASTSLYGLVRLAGNESFFETADGDSSDGLSEEEFLAAMPAGVLGAVDADGNGLLTTGEVTNTTHPFLRAVADLDGSGVVEEAEASAFFAAFDDGTAFLTGAEFMPAAAAAAVVQAWSFGGADTNGDGTLTPAEARLSPNSVVRAIVGCCNVSGLEFLQAMPGGAFSASDGDSNGLLTAAELEGLTAALIVVMSDTDNSSTVSAAEAAAIVSAYGASGVNGLTVTDVSTAAELVAVAPAAVFQSADTDRNGVIGGAEAAQSTNAVLRLAVGLAADVDGSGDISETEFLAAMPGGVFLAADSDRNGILTVGEVDDATAGVFRFLGDSDASGRVDGDEESAFFSAFDPGTIGFVPAPLFAALTASAGAGLAAHSFRDTDTDADGEVTLAEAAARVLLLAADAAVFAHADADTSGGLSAAEFLAALPAGALASTDTDRNGVVTAAELSVATTGVELLLGDTDGSGALEASEAATIIASLGQDGAAHLLPAEYAISGLLSLQIPAAAFADADANEDAVLTRVEARGASYALIHLAGDPVFLSTSDTDGSGGLSEGEFLSAMPAGAFAETDVDRDGLISQAELGTSESALFLTLADTDISGSLDAAEVATCVSVIGAPLSPRAFSAAVRLAEAAPASLFSATDADLSGFLTVAEAETSHAAIVRFSAGAANLNSDGLISGAEFINVMPLGSFSIADTDGDGTLSAAEATGLTDALAVALGDTDGSGALSAAEAEALVVAYDGDGRAGLSAAEFASAAASALAAPAAAFAAADADENGDLVQVEARASSDALVRTALTVAGESVLTAASFLRTMPGGAFAAVDGRGAGALVSADLAGATAALLLLLGDTDRSGALDAPEAAALVAARDGRALGARDVAAAAELASIVPAGAFNDSDTDGDGLLSGAEARRAGPRLLRVVALTSDLLAAEMVAMLPPAAFAVLDSDPIDNVLTVRELNGTHPVLLLLGDADDDGLVDADEAARLFGALTPASETFVTARRFASAVEAATFAPARLAGTADANGDGAVSAAEAAASASTLIRAVGEASQMLDALPAGAFLDADADADGVLTAVEIAASTQPLIHMLADVSGSGVVDMVDAANAIALYDADGSSPSPRESSPLLWRLRPGHRRHVLSQQLMRTAMGSSRAPRQPHLRTLSFASRGRRPRSWTRAT